MKLDSLVEEYNMGWDYKCCMYLLNMGFVETYDIAQATLSPYIKYGITPQQFKNSHKHLKSIDVNY